MTVDEVMEALSIYDLDMEVLVDQHSDMDSVKRITQMRAVDRRGFFSEPHGANDEAKARDCVYLDTWNGK